jgi:membrane protein implicated in regulation of membrane protease activity
VNAVYVSCAAFGGVLIVASIFLGHGHDADAGGGLDHGGAGHADSDDGGFGLAALLSLRFWVFALAFFGLTGLVLSALGLGGARLTVPLGAGVTGLAAGYVAARIFRTLARQSVGSVAPSSSHVGREGILLLPVARGQRGKLRMRVGATQVDLLAETDDDDPLPTGAPVLVCAMRGSVAVVAKSPTPIADTTPKEPSS